MATDARESSPVFYARVAGFIYLFAWVRMPKTDVALSA